MYAFDKRTFMEQIEDELESNSKTFNDINYVLANGETMSWEKFKPYVDIFTAKKYADNLIMHGTGWHIIVDYFGNLVFKEEVEEAMVTSEDIEEETFLDETIKVLEDNDKTPNDVLWVGNEHYHFDWGHFAELSNFVYDSLDSHEIAEDLTIVGDGWHMERVNIPGGFDEVEDVWMFIENPVKPKAKYAPSTLRARREHDYRLPRFFEIDKEVNVDIKE
jgi:hypothetical protein